MGHIYLCNQHEYTNIWGGVRLFITLIFPAIFSFYYLKKTKQAQNNEAGFLSGLIALLLVAISNYSYHILNVWNIDYTQERTVIIDVRKNRHTGRSSSTSYLVDYFSEKDSTTYTGKIDRMMSYEEARVWNTLNIGDSLCINHYQGRFWNVSKVYAVKEKGREPPE